LHTIVRQASLKCCTIFSLVKILLCSQLYVLDASGSRAWSSSFSRDDLEEALRQVRGGSSSSNSSCNNNLVAPNVYTLHQALQVQQ
jgi:hypothetical protein